ncbi:hypothetical protein ABPG77_002871 [Micractinium sp. CCAP 211/92]
MVPQCSTTSAVLRHGVNSVLRHSRAAPGARWVASAAAETSEAAAEASAGQQAPQPLDLQPLPADQLARNAALVERLRGQLILAPLTRGNHLPFRRLCADFGAEVTLSEMAFARQLAKGDRKERAILRRAENEQCYGVQIATNVIDEGVRAGEMAAEAGADFLDLNVGCPIYEATRRGLGAALLRKPKKLAKLVNGMATRLPLPLTVKVRLGESASKINVEEVAALLEQAGAAAVTIHGRTMEQRYKKPADWGLIERVAAARAVPVIGNGDVLTHYEAQRRMQGHGCLAVMVGRGALIAPWLFQEHREGRALSPTASERVGIYRQLVSHMKQHFRDDERGKRAAFYFLPWHFNFFSRYRPLPEAVYGDASLQRPLLSTRWESVACTELGETVEGLPLLERLLRCENEAAFGPMADALWDAGSDAEAEAALLRLAGEHLEGWEAELRAGADDRQGQRDERQDQG